jgi:uncharacterized protein (DUF305 family)
MTADTTTPPADNSGTPPVTTGVFEQLVGPGKKFDSQEALARGKMESDQFIQKLLEEKREAVELAQRLAQEVDSLKVKASILDRINPQNPNSVNQYGSQGTPQAPAQTPAAGLSAEDVVKLIESSKQHDLAQANIRQADSALIKALGSDAPAYVKQKAQELGMEVTDLYKVATKSPTAFLNMLGVTPNQTNSGSMYNQSNRPNSNNPGPEIRNEAYYNKLKKEMGILKFVQDARLQVQMHKDMQALGDSFFTT